MSGRKRPAPLVRVARQTSRGARVFGGPIVKLLGAGLESLVELYEESRLAREREFAEAVGRGLSPTAVPELLQALPDSELFFSVYRAMLADDDSRKARVYGEAMRSILMGLCPESLRFPVVSAVRGARWDTLRLLVESSRALKDALDHAQPGYSRQNLRWSTIQPILGPFKGGELDFEELAARKAAVSDLYQHGLVDDERSAAIEKYGSSPPEHTRLGDVVAKCISEAFEEREES